MASVNINSDISDPFYRYKMPRIIAKVEGKGNGIKTVIVNMPEVAKALSRPPTYPTKFFGCELGAQTQFDLKNDRFIVNGSHDAPKLQQLLDIFIKKFVLCPECHNPETTLTVSQKKQTIGQRCIACGYNGMVDMRHRLTPFILKNPPDMDPAATPTKASKKDKKGKKKGSEKEKDDDRASPEVNAQEQMAAQRASGGVIDAPPEIQNEEDDDDWGEDFSEDAVKQRMDELSEAAKQMAFTDDLEKTIEERLNIFYHFVKNKINSSEGVVGSMKEIFTEAERLEVTDKATMVLVELLLDNKILQQLKQYKVLFLKFCYENDKAQKYLLGGLEQLVGNVHKAELLPKMPHILKTLYDLDILDEKVIIEWGEKVSKKYVDRKIAQEIHDKSQPFIKWLKEAEEEEDSDEEEDEEENIEFITAEGRINVTEITAQVQYNFYNLRSFTMQTSLIVIVLAISSVSPYTLYDRCVKKCDSCEEFWGHKLFDVTVCKTFCILTKGGSFSGEKCTVGARMEKRVQSGIMECQKYCAGCIDLYGKSYYDGYKCSLECMDSHGKVTDTDCTLYSMFGK